MDTAGGGGIGKAAQELMQEMQKAQQEMQSKSGGPGGAGGAGGPNEAFQNAMNNTAVNPTTQANQVTASTHVNSAQQASNVLMQAKVNQTTPSTRVGEAAKTQRSQMANMLEGLINGQDKMTGIVKMALSGKQFNQQELLVMQAGVFRYSQELDLTGKVIEKATSGIKQTMNTQV